jgi:hypothetical protein
MPDAGAVLDLWDRAEREHPIDRDLSMLEVFTAQKRETLAELPLHRRDALLLASRVAAFGASLDGVAGCPQCACRVDVALTIPDRPAIPAEDGGELEVEGNRVSYRVPNSRDLAEAAGASDAVSAAKTLLSRCQLAGPRDESVERAIDREIARLCDASSLELGMACPQCHHEFLVPVDIGRFLWQEMAAYAQRLLGEVDALASRYGWLEADVLAMSEQRRKRYLEYCA